MHSPVADTNPLGSQAPPRLASRQLAASVGLAAGCTHSPAASQAL